MNNPDPSYIIDLSKVQAAYKSLEDSKSAELASLWIALENFKSSVGSDLNKAEFRQLMTILFNDQVVTEPPKDLMTEPPLRFRQPVTILKTGNFTLRAVI